MARKIYPTRENTSFLLAEDVRIEASGKISVAGLYPGARIVVFEPPSTEKPATLPLVFFFAFQDGRGTFRPLLSVTSPTGQEIFERKLDSNTKQHDRTSAFGVAVAPVRLSELGTYNVLLRLDTHEYPFQFILQEVPKAIADGKPSRKKTARKAKRKKS